MKIKSIIDKIILQEMKKSKIPLKEGKIPKLNWQNEDEIISAAGLDVSGLEDLDENPQEFKKFLNWLKTLPERVILDGMDSGNYLPMLFPSFYSGPIPYPAFLASALVKSRSAEPFTDIGNIYYSRRKVSPEARSVFEQALFKSDPFGDSGWTMEDEFSDYNPKGRSKITDYLKAPELRKFIKTKYPKLAQQYNIH